MKKTRDEDTGMAEFIGQTIREYRIEAQIGRGGHGVVFRAVHVPTERTVAVKVLLPEYLEDPKMAERLELEASIVRELKHPHIVHYEDSWNDEYGAWLVMRYLSGGSLRELMTRHPQVPLEHVARITKQIVAALECAHAAGIIHRDMKPDNIILDDEGNAYLTDFGIAKRLGYKAITSMGVVLGSPAYLTPEQILGAEVSARTDIFSLGMTLYEVLAGQHPFGKIKGQVQLMMMLLQSDVPPLAREDIPPAVAAVIAKALTRDVAGRYESVNAFWQAWQEAHS
jgi:serine/threonine protein kinase